MMMPMPLLTVQLRASRPPRLSGGLVCGRAGSQLRHDNEASRAAEQGVCSAVDGAGDGVHDLQGQATKAKEEHRNCEQKKMTIPGCTAAICCR